MSDGKGSSYRVVSPEELRRRALAAANDRLARANERLLEVEVIVAAAEATYGSIDVSVPKSHSFASSDPAEVEAAAARVEGEVVAARARAEEAIAAARVDHMNTASAELLASLRPADAPRELSRPAPREVAEDTRNMETAARIMRRLPADVPGEVVAHCEALAAEAASRSDPARAEIALTSLRAAVQAARERSESISRNRAAVDELLVEVDGLEGEQVGALRGFLRGLPLDAALPADLEAKVQSMSDEARRERDKRFALRVTRDVLEQQGYEVEDDFLTVVASSDGALLPLASSAGHAVRVRERAGQLLFNVVRYEQSAASADDVAASTAFCDSFASIVQRVGDQGLELTRVVHFDPGSGHVEVRDEHSPFAEAHSAKKHQKERERGRPG